MNCREFADFLDRYIHDEVAPDERGVFDAHLAECPACVAYLDGYRKTMLFTRSAVECESALAVAPPELLQAILAISRPPM